MPALQIKHLRHDRNDWLIASMPTSVNCQLKITLCNQHSDLPPATLWNYASFHKFFRFVKVTEQTAGNSMRFSAFKLNRNSYVVLHLKGERRLFGWPRRWPSAPTDEYYLIEEYSWLSDNAQNADVENQTDDNVGNTSHILISKLEVEMIEFLDVKNSNSESE